MKNNLLFLIIFLLILISISYGLSKSNTSPTIKEEPNFETKIKKLSFYKQENNSRYLTYSKENTKLSPKQVVTHVNIGLDKPFYTNVKKAPRQNKTTILVNKYFSLDESYVPKNLEPLDEAYSRKGMYLVKEAKKAFEALSLDASLENLTIKAMSTYRSFSYQNNLYTTYVKKDGEDLANTYSAKPGHSEHQTGLALDVYNETTSYTDFENTQEYTWMQKNAYKYGFILRYPKEKEKITGYSYESWHYRYVGFEIAEYIQKHNLTYDEYYMQFLD